MVIAVAVVLGFGQPPLKQGSISPAVASEDPAKPEAYSVATFAGGCFWCIESTFEKIDGVVEAVSGFAGGNTENPTYREVVGGSTGHTETVQIHFDPSRISYSELLHWFWRDIDPTDAGGQFVDRGSMYRPAVFYHDDEQKKWVEESLAALEASGRYAKPLAVEVLPFEKFWEAEDYHQDYYRKKRPALQGLPPWLGTGPVPEKNLGEGPEDGIHAKRRDAGQPGIVGTEPRPAARLQQTQRRETA